jgi:syntaxin 5
MGVDRTNEFLATVATLQRSGAETSSPFEPSASSHHHVIPEGQATQFSKAASVISRGIHETTLKLERLTKLAKKQSLYEDNSAKVHELTVAIKGDLQILDADLKSLNQFVEDGRIQSTKHSKENSTAIVDNLKSQLAFTTKSFAEVLQIRTKTLKEQHHRQKNFGDSSSALPRSKANRFVDDVPTQETLAAQEQMVVREDVYHSSRAQQVENIEGMIHELGQMYVKLTSIIDMQGEMAIRIDENMTTALDNTENGHRELMITLSRVSGNQWLILKVFAVLITFATFFVVFVA